MADISQIKLPNGSTYDIKDNTSGYTKNTGTITSVKTTAGNHTTINVTSGAANFNVPTNTSHLTNDSGYKKFHIVEASIPLMGGTPTIDSTYTQILNWIEAEEEVIIINTQSGDTRYYFHSTSDTILMFYSLSGWELDIKSNDIRHYEPSWITLDNLPIYDGTVE